MKNQSKISFILRKTEENTVVRTIRGGLVNIIPVLMIGAFALIFKTFPVKAYQNAIAVFMGGFFLKLFDVVYSATFGVLSVYMTFSISRAYIRQKTDSGAACGGAIIASLMSFFILAGAYLPGFGTDQMGPKSMFLAIISGLGASVAYNLIYSKLQKNKKNLFSPVADREFKHMLQTFSPIVIVGLLFGLVNAVVIKVFDVDSFRTLLSTFFNYLFSFGDTGFFKGLFFVLLSSLLWFFGIHGSDTLEEVMQKYFVPGLSVNQAAVMTGNTPSVVLTKEFFDCFVLMGGCGTTICLLIAILIFSRNRARRGLGLAAAFPMIFNINEMMVFGLPIIFNPIMFIPFIAVPLINYSVAYAAISLGIVPFITSNVEWTTPVILGGYTATGSIAGSMLQVFCIALGVLIYFPFVRMLDRATEEKAKKNFDSFMAFFTENEQNFNSTKITELNSIHGDYARDLCNDLRYGLKDFHMAYQPQYDYSGKCVGAEALLRYDHPMVGMLYPPLVIKLAEEGGFLPELEELVMQKAIADRPKLTSKFGEDTILSINVTGTTVVTPRYVQFCEKLNEQDPFAGKNICIEITEQAALLFNDDTVKALQRLREMGLKLAIDDFSMGQTSIHYLRDNLFDIIKLDGSLVGGITEKNTHDIISSIVQLSKTLDLEVVAEYVDTEEKRQMLHEIGCDIYQGYLFSPAVFLYKLR